MNRRSNNFTSEESAFLVSRVAKYRGVIESKKTDRATIEKKAKAWREIEREYNAELAGVHRSLKTLKTKYENMKKTAKRNCAIVRKETCPLVLLPFEETFSDYCKPEEVAEGLDAAYDSEPNKKDLQISTEMHGDGEEAEETTGKSRCRDTADIWADVAAAKLGKLQLEIDYFKKESELKLAKLALEIKLLKRELASY